jgi:hypothetical protein
LISGPAFVYDAPVRRVLGLFGSSLLVVGAVFGSGIFLTTGIVADHLPFSRLIWIVWIAAGLITMAGGLCYAELGSLFPRAGGPYVYLKEAYGTAAAFVFGWKFLWIIGGGGVAALAVGFAEYAVGVFGTGMVLLLYLAANVVYSIALPMEEMRGRCGSAKRLRQACSERHTRRCFRPSSRSRSSAVWVPPFWPAPAYQSRWVGMGCFSNPSAGSTGRRAPRPMRFWE